MSSTSVGQSIMRGAGGDEPDHLAIKDSTHDIGRFGSAGSLIQSFKYYLHFI